MQSYLVRAHSIHVEAGLLDKLKTVGKKAMLTLISLGFMTSLAHGKTFDKSVADDFSKEMNQAFEEVGSDITMTTSVAKNKIEFIYEDSSGNKSKVILTSGKNGENFLQRTGIGNKEVNVLAEDLRKTLEAEMKKEKIKIVSPDNTAMRFGD